MNTIAYFQPTRITRLGAFLLLALPGAWLVATFGSLLGTPDIWLDSGRDAVFCVVSVVVGAGLILLGTRTTKEPLFLLVFVPMPMLISLGFHLGYLGRDAGFFIAVLGMMWPMIVYRPVSRYYKRKAFRAPSPRSAGVLARSNDQTFPMPPNNTSAPDLRTLLRARTPALRGNAPASNVQTFPTPPNSTSAPDLRTLLRARTPALRGNAPASGDTTTFNFRASILNNQSNL